MYAFVAVHDDQDEGIVSIRGPDGYWHPLVGADMARVDDLRKAARKAASAGGKAVRLLRFSVREELEVFEP